MNHNIKVLPSLLTGYRRVSLLLIRPGCVDVWHQSNCTQWRFLRASAGKDIYMVLPAFGWSHAGLQDLIQTVKWGTALTRDFVQLSHHAQTVDLRVTWIFFHEKFVLGFIFIFFLVLLYPWDQYLILQGKHRRRLMFQYAMLLEPPAGGENLIPEALLKVFPCQGHPENIWRGSSGAPRR